MRNKPKKHVGKVTAIQYAQGDEHPPEQQARVYRFPEIFVKKKYDPFVYQPSYISFKIFMHVMDKIKDRVDNSKKNNQKVLIPLRDGVGMYGLEDEDLTPSQQKYLVESTNRMFDKNGWYWFHMNASKFRAKLLRGLRRVHEVDCEEWLTNYNNAVEAREQVRLQEEERIREEQRIQEEAMRNVIEAIAKNVGKVIAIKYSDYYEYPLLLIDSTGDSSYDDLDGYAIIKPELMEKTHGTLATGDVVECIAKNASDEIAELINFRIIERKEPKNQWETRYLRIHHPDGHFDNWGEAGAKPGEVDMSHSDWELLEEGDCVFRLDWEGMYAGVSSIVRLGSTYYYDMDGQVFGRFSSLRDALRWSEMDTFNTATISIECSEMDSETIADMLQPQADWLHLQDNVEPGFRFEINGEEWELSDQGTLKRSN
jgi:hypothetical protein